MAERELSEKLARRLAKVETPEPEPVHAPPPPAPVIAQKLVPNPFVAKDNSISIDTLITEALKGAELQSNSNPQCSSPVSPPPTTVVPKSLGSPTPKDTPPPPLSLANLCKAEAIPELDPTAVNRRPMFKVEHHRDRVASPSRLFLKRSEGESELERALAAQRRKKTENIIWAAERPQSPTFRDGPPPPPPPKPQSPITKFAPVEFADQPLEMPPVPSKKNDISQIPQVAEVQTTITQQSVAISAESPSSGQVPQIVSESEPKPEPAAAMINNNITEPDAKVLTQAQMSAFPKIEEKTITPPDSVPTPITQVTEPVQNESNQALPTATTEAPDQAVSPPEKEGSVSTEVGNVLPQEPVITINSQSSDSNVSVSSQQTSTTLTTYIDEIDEFKAIEKALELECEDSTKENLTPKAPPQISPKPTVSKEGSPTATEQVVSPIEDQIYDEPIPTTKVGGVIGPVLPRPPALPAVSSKPAVSPITEETDVNSESRRSKSPSPSFPPAVPPTIKTPTLLATPSEPSAAPARPDDLDSLISGLLNEATKEDALPETSKAPAPTPPEKPASPHLPKLPVPPPPALISQKETSPPPLPPSSPIPPPPFGFAGSGKIPNGAKPIFSPPPPPTEPPKPPRSMIEVQPTTSTNLDHALHSPVSISTSSACSPRTPTALSPLGLPVSPTISHVPPPPPTPVKPKPQKSAEDELAEMLERRNKILQALEPAPSK